MTDSQLIDDSMTFADLGVADDLVTALEQEGILHPFPIQAMTLPTALDGSDITGKAKTGTSRRSASVRSLAA